MGVSQAAANAVTPIQGKLAWVGAPWLMLVKPAACWSLLRDDQALWPALLWQFAAVIISRALSAHAMKELDVAAHIPAAASGNSWVWFILSLVLLLGLVLGANLALAFIIKLAALFTGAGLRWRDAVCIAAYALIPFALGDALGRIAFSLILPLSTEAAGAWGAHLRPFSLGLASFTPQGFPALGFSWFYASFFDLFGLWCLASIWGGLRRLTGLKASRSLWIMLGVVLLLALVLAAAWQVAQLALLRAAH